MKKHELLVRDVDPELVKVLKQRDAANNKSAESEHRVIQERALLGSIRVPISAVLLQIPSEGKLHRGVATIRLRGDTA